MYILQIQEAGFDILSNEERTLTEAEMQVFYQHRAREVSSSAPIGPSHSLFSSSNTMLAGLGVGESNMKNKSMNSKWVGNGFALRI